MAESLSVLVIDDSKSLRANFQRLLEEQGHRMLGAASEGEALRILEREKPDVVVTDLYLPEIKGIGFVDWLGSSLPYAAVIVLSRKDSQDEVREVIRRGVWDYLEKPVQMSERAQAVNGALKQASLVSEACDSKKTEDHNDRTGSSGLTREAHKHAGTLYQGPSQARDFTI